MKFSVVLIAKNEEQTLPRLMESLKGVDEVVLVDTGSTDRTAQVARELGCVVFEEGSRFLEVVDEKMAEEINALPKKYGEDLIVKAGDKAFNYSKARNYAAEKARNDWVFQPDCDEVVKWNFDELSRILDDHTLERLEYNFIYAHDADGNPAVSFLHSKFYKRTNFHWTRMIHEVLVGKGMTKFLPPEVIELHHWQNPGTDRSHYLVGLAIDCNINPYDDRNTHYYGRELMYKARYNSAAEILQKHANGPGWIIEQAQSLTFAGDCMRALKRNDDAIHLYYESIRKFPMKREGYYGLGTIYLEIGMNVEAIAFLTACIQIPKPNFYASMRTLYEDWPLGQLAIALWNSGRKDEAFKTLQEALRYDPKNPTYLNNLKYSIPTPKVSIVIPTLGRRDRIKNLLRLIRDKAGYENCEVILVHDGEEIEDKYMGIVQLKNETRLGAPMSLKKGVEASTGDLVMFLGNDCLPKDNFVIQAVWKMFQEFGPAMDGMVALNDGYWNGEIATHWLASKKLLPKLDGEFFHAGYKHFGCDNELTQRVKMLGKYAYAPLAEVEHDHPIKGRKPDEVNEIANATRDADNEYLKQRAEKLGFELVQNLIHPSQRKIPKRIFTIWLNEDPIIPEKVQEWIKTHRIKGYEHKLITLDNVYRNKYIQDAIDAKQWVKAADYVRLHYLYTEGGIYLDADMEVLPGRDFDNMLHHSLFCSREANGFVANSCIGAEKGSLLIKECMDRMDQLSGSDERIFENGMELFTHVVSESKQDGLMIYPAEVFIPFNHQTGETKYLPNTKTYHHWLKSWVKEKDESAFDHPPYIKPYTKR